MLLQDLNSFYLRHRSSKARCFNSSFNNRMVVVKEKTALIRMRSTVQETNLLQKLLRRTWRQENCLSREIANVLPNLDKDSQICYSLWVIPTKTSVREVMSSHSMNNTQTNVAITVWIQTEILALSRLTSFKKTHCSKIAVPHLLSIDLNVRRFQTLIPIEKLWRSIARRTAALMIVMKLATRLKQSSKSLDCAEQVITGLLLSPQ